MKTRTALSVLIAASPALALATDGFAFAEAMLQ